MATSDSDPLHEAILTVAARRARALVDGDVAAVGVLLADGFVYVNSLGQRLDRAAYLAFVGGRDMRWSAQHLDDVQVHSFGDAVVMTCRLVDEGHWRGEPVRWSWVSTQVYVRRDGEYLYAAGHTSAPAE